MQLLRLIRTGDFSSRLISGTLLLTLACKAAPLLLLGGRMSVWFELLLLASPLLGGLVAAVIRVPVRRRCILLQDAIDAMQSIFVVYDREDRVVFSNQRFRAFVGLSDGDVPAGTPYAKVVQAVLSKLELDAATWRSEFARRLKMHQVGDGKPADRLYPGNRWVREIGTRTALGGKVVIGVDVTEIHALLGRLNHELARFSALAERIPVAICQLDRDGELTYVNRTFREMFGVTETEAFAAARGERPGDGAGIHTLMQRLNENEGGSEVVVPLRERHYLARKASLATTDMGQDGRALECPQGEHIYILVDVTERKNLAIRMQQLVMHDPLTGAFNRVAFADDVGKAVDGADADAPSFLIAMDLDRFKPVNDVYGHLAGDDLLRQVVGRITGVLPDGARLYRVGGDEFCVLGSGFGREAAAEVADALVKCLLVPFPVLGHRVQIGVSVGVSVLPHDAQTADTLVHFADLAMYRVKEGGGNQVSWFDEDILATVDTRRALEADFTAALQAGDLTLAYQPIVGRERSFVHGLEALVRWTNRRTGQVMPPDAFIPIAEETGLVHDMDMQLFALAIAQFSRWTEERIAPGLLTVNMSTRSLEAAATVDAMLDMLRRSGVPGRAIVIELKESFAARNATDLCRTIRTLAGHGLRFAIDDFGTGYTSLRLLADLPIDFIKIDRSFVGDLTTLPQSPAVAIVRAILNVAGDLRLGVVAAGVESETQLSVLHGLDCTLFQGHLLGEPECATAATERLRRQSYRPLVPAGRDTR